MSMVLYQDLSAARTPVRACAAAAEINGQQVIYRIPGHYGATKHRIDS
jgi:hypothetical protein